MSRIRVVDGVAPASTTEPRDSSAALALATSFSSCEYVHEPPLLQPPRTANRHTTRARAASREVACTIMWSTVACAERNRFKTHLPLLFLHAVPVHTGLEPLSCALLAPLLWRLLGVGRRAFHFGVGLVARTTGTLCIRAGTATVVAHSGHERRENIDGRGCIGNGGCHSRVGRCFTLALASAAGAVHWHRGHRSGPGTHPRIRAATNTLPCSNQNPSTCTQSLVSRLPGRGQCLGTQPLGSWKVTNRFAASIRICCARSCLEVPPTCVPTPQVSTPATAWQGNASSGGHRWQRGAGRCCANTIIETKYQTSLPIVTKSIRGADDA